MKQTATVSTDALLTDTQAAGILGCSVTHFRNLVRARHLPAARRFGARARWLMSEISAALKLLPKISAAKEN